LGNSIFIHPGDGEMPSPARAGAILYTKDLLRVSDFYRQLLDMKLQKADAEHHVIESNDMQMIIHAIPAHIAESFSISSPPELRMEQAIKIFYTVPSMSAAEKKADSLGGSVFGDKYTGPGFTIRNAYDPEGNIFQIRENIG